MNHNFFIIPSFSSEYYIFSRGQ